MAVTATQQQQHADKHQHMLHHLAEQQLSILDQLAVAQDQTSQHLWDQLAHTTHPGEQRPDGGDLEGRPAIRIQKMMADDDLKALLDASEQSAWVAG